ncbi:MAG: hypothetical protein H6731_00800 [Myxococcales bacterium]|nr:MAG: hypothetical protein H6731_00800 [Myxococcales bacterium]
MKYIAAILITIFTLISSGCADTNSTKNHEESISASEFSSSDVPTCQKSMPPKCFVNGKPIKTTMAGTAIKDESGNYIFLD